VENEELVKRMVSTTDDFAYQFNDHESLRAVKYLYEQRERLKVENALLKATWHKHQPEFK
jgi:hypothetical protein